MKLASALKKLASLNIEVSNLRNLYSFCANGKDFEFIAQDDKVLYFAFDGMVMNNLKHCLEFAGAI